MTATEHYRRLRARDPYLPACIAWAVAKDAAAAEAAGVRTWADDDAVTIEGHAYRLTIGPPDFPSWDGDCFGTIEDRGSDDWGHPDPVAWPCVPLPRGHAEDDPSRFYSATDTYYDPGESYDPDIDRAWRWRKGLSRHDVYLAQRRGLIREGVMIRDTYERVIVLTDPDDGWRTALGGVGLDPDDTLTLSYLWEVARELAAEIVYDRARAREAAAERAERAALESLSVAMLAALTPTPERI